MVIDFPWFGSVELEKLQAKYLMDSDPEYDAWFSLGEYLDLNIYRDGLQWKADIYPVYNGITKVEKLLDSVVFDWPDPEYKVELLSGGGYGAIVHTPSGRTVDVMVYDRERGRSYLISGKNPDDYGVVVAFDSWCFDSDCDNQ